MRLTCILRHCRQIPDTIEVEAVEQKVPQLSADALDLLKVRLNQAPSRCPPMRRSRGSGHSPELTMPPRCHQLQWCLAYEPSDRPSCAELLNHKYFEGFAEWFEPQLKEALDKDAQDFVMFKKRKVRPPPGPRCAATLPGCVGVRSRV